MKNESGRAYVGLLIFFALVALVAVPLALLFAADITPSYTFTSGDRVTHTKLNNAASGTINTTFYSGKSSAGSNPNTAFEILIRDTSLDVFKRSTLSAAFFDHTSLLSARTAKTVPVLADATLLEDSAASSAYRRISITNLLFAGAATGAPTNETLFPALRGGALGSITLSNVIGGLTSHSLPTNGDAIMVITENGGRAVKTMTLASMFTGMTYATTNHGTNTSLIWDGQLRAIRETNKIDGLTATTTPATNDYVTVLSSGQLRKVLLNDLRGALIFQNIVQSKYTGTTNIAGSSGNWSNVTVIGSSSLSNAITPRATSSKILVRLTMQACAGSAGNPGSVRILRDGSAIGTGDDDSANRTEAGATVPNQADPGAVTWEWLDSPSTTSEVKYWVQVKATTGSTVYLNRGTSDSNNENSIRPVSTLTLTEVFQ